jgi:hypothetical protein
VRSWRPGDRGRAANRDLVPFRRNVVRAIILRQLDKAGFSLADLKAKRKRGQLLPGAMVEYGGAAAYRRISGPFV